MKPTTAIFRGWVTRGWAFVVLAGLGASLRSEPVISEFMAVNTAVLADEDGEFSDWIELHNPGPGMVDLTGWHLTDTPANKTRWQFPEVTLPAGGFLILFASVKDRRDPGSRLHTNFALDADGEYLALVRPDGSTVAWESAPQYPKQQDNQSFGVAAGAAGGRPVYLARPTPGAPNSGPSAIGIPETVGFSHPAGPFRENFLLTLTAAGEGRQIRYVVAPSSAGATAPEPSAASPLYTAPIAITTPVVVRAALFAADGSTRGATRTVHYSAISPALAGFASDLPILVIDSLGSGELIKDGVDHPAWLALYGSRTGGAPVFAAAPEVVTPLTVTVRGASSAEFPKKGYNLELKDEFGRRRASALLDLAADDRWALVAPWKFDLGYLNNHLVHALSHLMGRWAPRTRLVEVYFNSNDSAITAADYAGIYVLTERIEVGKRRVDLATLTPDEVAGADLTGGYILKIDTPDPDETGWRTRRGLPDSSSSAIVLVSPRADDIAPAQLAYLRDYVQRMEDALFASRESGWVQRGYLDYLDRAAWVDHHLLNTFAANPDAFERSAFFTKDRNGRLAAGPVWDFDRALGSYWDERSYRFDVWSGVGATDVWETGWWGVLARDPEFRQDWVDRWQALRRDQFSSARLSALVTSLSAGLDAAAGRDVARWPDNAKPSGSLAGQLNHLRSWLTQRADWIDSQFVAAPVVAVSGDALTLTAPAGAELIYTLDGSDPRSLGGESAPNARRTTAPLIVPASANVHARSHRAEWRERYPGSPWSSAVGGPASSPLAPAARLVNLSARAVVGSGEDALIAGIVVADTGSKRFLARGIGPTLASFGAVGVVPDPHLAIYGGAGGELARNDGWESGPDARRMPGYARSVGAFPLAAGSRDAALASELHAGAYTVQVTTPTGRLGVGLAELYELDANGRTLNLSTRAAVRSGEGVLIGGFVVSGPAFKRMLVRAVGPALQGFGVGGFLRDPVLTLRSGQTVVAANDRWAATDAEMMADASRRVGAFALAPDSEDAAVLVTLPPGAYTVEVKGKDGGEGVALLEIYEVP